MTQLIAPNNQTAYGPSPPTTITVTGTQTPEEAALVLRDVVGSLDLDASQQKLVRWLDRIDREIGAGGEACRAVDEYLGEIARLAGLRPERGPLAAYQAALLTARTNDLRTALGCPV